MNQEANKDVNCCPYVCYVVVRYRSNVTLYQRYDNLCSYILLMTSHFKHVCNCVECLLKLHCLCVHMTQLKNAWTDLIRCDILQFYEK
jgi:hypothetical protein